MDKVIFSACVYNCPEGVYGATADMDLPATEYELEDALQKVRDGEGGETMVSVESFGVFPFLRSHIGEEENLRALNALANKLTTLEGWQIDAFEGLVRIDENNGVGIDLPRLYDLGSSVDSCQVLYEATDLASLGRFFAENDFVQELENVPEQAWDLLDFEAIGRRMADRECGAFIGERGYVVRIDDLKEEFKDLDLTPKKPDYTALLEVSIMDSGQSMTLELPCGRAAIENVRAQLGANDLSVLSWRCVDCLVPALRDAFSQEDNIGYANHAAKQLRDLPQSDLLAYKALVEATRCSDLSTAMRLMDSVDSYWFTRKYDGPEAVALDELSVLLGENDRATLLPFIELHRYGEKLIEEQNISMTPYGGIERKDRQPIQAVCHESQMGGMSMM